MVSVNAVGKDGRVAEKPIQVIPVGRNAHSIRVDATNRYVYTPTLGSDEIFQFRFDAKSGKLASNTPAIVLMKAGTGPRHFITSKDNKFAYLLSERMRKAPRPPAEPTGDQAPGDRDAMRSRIERTLI